MRVKESAITRYDVCELACFAYSRSLSQENLHSAFRKTGMYPLNRSIINNDIMKPSEIFQSSRSTDQVNQEIQEQPDSEVMDTLVTGSEEVEETEVSDRIDVEDTNVDFVL